MSAKCWYCDADLPQQNADEEEEAMTETGIKKVRIDHVLNLRGLANWIERWPDAPIGVVAFGVIALLRSAADELEMWRARERAQDVENLCGND